MLGKDAVKTLSFLSLFDITMQRTIEEMLKIYKEPSGGANLTVTKLCFRVGRANRCFFLRSGLVKFSYLCEFCENSSHEISNKLKNDKVPHLQSLKNELFCYFPEITQSQFAIVRFLFRRKSKTVYIKAMMQFRIILLCLKIIIKHSGRKDLILS